MRQHTTYPHEPQPQPTNGDSFAIYQHYIRTGEPASHRHVCRLETWHWYEDEGDDGHYWDFENMEKLTRGALTIGISKTEVLQALITGRFAPYEGIIDNELEPEGIIR